MNKQEFVNTLNTWLEENQINSCDTYVSHGGMLLLVGLRSSTDDIDLTVTKEVWDKFEVTGLYPVVNIGNGTYLMSVTDVIDIRICERRYSRLIETDGIQHPTLEETLEDYLVLNRPKDQETIKLLKKLLQ